MKLNLQKITALLAGIVEADERIADRGPIKLLPRKAEEIPNVLLLREQIREISKQLRVKRKSATAKGHDLDADGKPLGYDLKAVGTIEEVRNVKRGTDRAVPNTTVLVRVFFPAGEHLWFDPDDLVMVPDQETLNSGKVGP